MKISPTSGGHLPERHHHVLDFSRLVLAPLDTNTRVPRLVLKTRFGQWTGKKRKKRKKQGFSTNNNENFFSSTKSFTHNKTSSRPRRKKKKKKQNFFISSWEHQSLALLCLREGRFPRSVSTMPKVSSPHERKKNPFEFRLTPNIVFESRTQAKTHITRLLLLTRQCLVEHGCHEFDILAALLKRHPDLEKQTANPKVFSVQSNDVSGKSDRNSFVVKYRNSVGEWVDFSIKTCLEGKKSASVLTQTMREAVVEQIAAWKKQNTVTACQKCGFRYCLQVDHKDVPFNELMKTFLTKRGDIPSEFVSCPNRAGIKMLADSPFKTEWQNFHQSKATYQVLCRLCNGRKGG